MRQILGQGAPGGKNHQLGPGPAGDEVPIGVDDESKGELLIAGIQCQRRSSGNSDHVDDLRAAPSA